MNRYIIPHVEDLRELLMVAEWRRHNRGAMAPMKIFLSVANGANVFFHDDFPSWHANIERGALPPLPASRALAFDPDFSFCRPARLPIMIKSPR